MFPISPRGASKKLPVSYYDGTTDPRSVFFCRIGLVPRLLRGFRKQQEKVLNNPELWKRYEIKIGTRSLSSTLFFLAPRIWRRAGSKTSNIYSISGVRYPLFATKSGSFVYSSRLSFLLRPEDSPTFWW
jgi:hypothetical protein